MIIMTRKEYIDMMLSEYKITHIEGLSNITTKTISNDSIVGHRIAFRIKMNGTDNYITLITKGYTTKLHSQCVFVPYDSEDSSIITFHQEIEIWNEIMEKKQSLIKLIELL